MYNARHTHSPLPPIALAFSILDKLSSKGPQKLFGCYIIVTCIPWWSAWENELLV